VFSVCSVSIVSGYGLDDRAIEFRFPAGAKGFSSSLCVQTGSGAHPASFTMGTGGPFPGDKARPGRDADHSPHLVPRSSMSRSYMSSPPRASMACSETSLLLGEYVWVWCIGEILTFLARFQPDCSRCGQKRSILSNLDYPVVHPVARHYTDWATRLTICL
jgi:hypothetical protein